MTPIPPAQSASDGSPSDPRALGEEQTPAPWAASVDPRSAVEATRSGGIARVRALVTQAGSLARSKRFLGGAAVGAVIAVIGANLYIMVGGPVASEPELASPTGTADLPLNAATPVPGPAPSAQAEATAASPDELDDRAVDQEAPSDENKKPPTKKHARAGRRANTVGEALAAACSTSIVDGLSRQIIAEARCAEPQAFAPVPHRKNLVIGGQVNLFLEAPARDHLVHLLDTHPQQTLTVNSALRTIAQQYLLSRWAAKKQCGIEIAAVPGESNHESGIALDIREPGTWRPLLEKEGFQWFGSSDRVHFDYKGAGSVDHTGLDVLSFQRLWNRNHPEDAVPESGRFGADTEARLAKSPVSGFAKGPRCSHEGPRRAAAE